MVVYQRAHTCCGICGTIFIQYELILGTYKVPLTQTAAELTPHEVSRNHLSLWKIAGHHLFSLALSLGPTVYSHRITR